MFGYHGKYLHVDATSGAGQFVDIPADVLRRFIGGSGLGVYLLLKHGAAEVDPLSADASLAFVFSPLVGSPLTTSAKFAVVSKSPLTDRINDSLASSRFAIDGKQTGCDAILITGRAEVPSVLIIDDGQVSVEPAGAVWGTSCSEAQSQLHERYGSDFSTAVIGPAGENQVRYATISHDGRHAGRGGSGTVLGSKNLKAVLVRGSKRAKWSDPNGLATYAKQLSKKSFGPATAKYRELGTASNLLLFNRLGTLPTRNFQEGHFDEVVNLAPETLSESRKRAQATCAACTIGCEHIYSLRENDGAKSTDGVRIEYENLFALGPLCGIGDADAVLDASKKCDELGLDTISAGGTIAFAMECVERGLLDAPWLKFGSGEALLRAIDEIASGEGIGRQLREGSRRLAMQLNNNSVAFAPQVKGLEIPGYDPRSLQTMALGFAVGTRGADHNRSGAYEADFSEHADRFNVSLQSVPLAIDTEDRAALMDSLILCKFLRGVFEDFCEDAAEMLQLVTGWNVAATELRQTAQRIVSAKKLFNIRAGWTPDEDTLPERFFGEGEHSSNSPKLESADLNAAIASYNVSRGWNAKGWLDEAHLAKLNLELL